jgi:hypothetical protein
MPERPLTLLFMFGGPITYILNVIDTWQGNASIFVKLLLNITLDAFLAVIWPITWVLWIVMHLYGSHTPLRIIFG